MYANAFGIFLNIFAASVETVRLSKITFLHVADVVPHNATLRHGMLASRFTDRDIKYRLVQVGNGIVLR